MIRIRVGIAEDQEIFRTGLAHLLNSFKNVEVNFQAENGQQLLDNADLNELDVIVLDYQMPKLNGVQTSKILREKYPKLKIIILSMFEDEAYVEKAIECGANAYLSKDDNLEELEQAIHAIINNQYYFNDRISKVFIKNMVGKGKIEPTFIPDQIEFSPFEIQVLDLISQELTTKEIADQLYRSTRTIEKHRTEMMRKTETKNSVGLVMYGIKKGILKT